MPHVAHIHMVFSLLDMVRTPSAGNFTTRVPWMFSRRLKMSVKPLGMSREQNRRYKIGYSEIVSEI